MTTEPGTPAKEKEQKSTAKKILRYLRIALYIVLAGGFVALFVKMIMAKLAQG